MVSTDSPDGFSVFVFRFRLGVGATFRLALSGALLTESLFGKRV